MGTVATIPTLVSEDHVNRMLVRAITKAATPSPEEASRQLAMEEQAAWTDVADKIISPPWDLTRLLMLYEECAIHAACIQAKATDAVGAGWRLIKEGTSGSQAPGRYVREEKRLTAQLKEITPELSFERLLNQAAIEQGIFGWGIWEIIRAPTRRRRSLGPIIGIYPVRGQTIRAAKAPGLYVQQVGAKKRWFKRFGMEEAVNVSTGGELNDGEPASELLIFQNYCHRSNYYGGLSWIAGVPAIAELTAIREYNVSWFSSGGTADRLVLAKAADGVVAEKLATKISETIKANAGRGHLTIVIDGTEDVDVKVTSLSPAFSGRGEGNRERQFRGGREDLLKEVLTAHQTPPYRVGWADAMAVGGTSSKDMLRTYREGAVKPIRELIQITLNRTLFGPQGIALPKGLEWDLMEIDWDLIAANLEEATKGVLAGVITPSEGRELIGYPEAKESDKGLHAHYIGVNMQRISGEGLPMQQQPGAPSPTAGKKTNAATLTHGMGANAQ